MTNITVKVTGAQVEAALSGILTAGMVGIPAAFSFDAVWEPLEKVALFRAGGEVYCIRDITDTVTVPWEVLEKKGCTLYVGVYGVSQEGTLAIPTLWAELGKIQPGADPEGTESCDPTLPVWKQAMDLAQSVREDADRGFFDGHSPVRGVDYWTEADQQEILRQTEIALIGDMETALDRILAIQNELIGGGAA